MKENILVSGPVTSEMISARLIQPSENKETGGQSLFLGRVRADMKGHRRVNAIEYSAYEAMVNKEAEIIKNELLSEFDDVSSIVILHSVGIVMAGEISLLVIISGCHRIQAMAACSRAVDMIKEKLPVWKKEIFEDDTRQWVHDHLA